MFKIIFYICLALVGADINLNRVRFGEDAFAGYKIRTIPDNSKTAQNTRKSERNALQNHMRNSYRKRMF